MNKERAGDRLSGTFCFFCHKLPSPFVLPLSLCVRVCVCAALLLQWQCVSVCFAAFVLHASDVKSRVLGDFNRFRDTRNEIRNNV